MLRARWVTISGNVDPSLRIRTPIRLEPEIAMRAAHQLFLLPLFFALASCGGGGGANYGTNPPTSGGNSNPPSPSTSTAITVGNDAFSPSSTTVAVGSTVTWSWDACQSDGYGGQLCESHNVTFDDGPKSATQSSGSFARTFDAAGTYHYHCTIHGAAMSGSVEVK